jgi:hypothetical protein
MKMTTKTDIFKTHLPRWLAIEHDREARGVMAEEIARIAKVHIKSVSRSFRRVQTSSESGTDNRGRPVRYGADVRSALFDVWDAASRPCGELLKPVVEAYVFGFMQEVRWLHSKETTKELFAMSEGTMKRKCTALQKKHGVFRGKSTTRASELKHIIPIFKGPWAELAPGHAQIDTVAHCGGSVAGDFAYTLSFVDSSTYWGVRRAQWNKGQESTKNNLVYIKNHLPFPWIMAHPDTGSEFINWLTKGWCEENGIALTRSEPGKKNDNMYVEERNGHVVRKFLAWHRFDADAGIADLMNDYYVVLDLYLNHFTAVRRTISKERIGARYHRTFEPVAKTPYARLMEHPSISQEIKNRVRQEHDSLNPLLLKEQLDTLKAKIFTYQKQAVTEANYSLSR